jgi:hypothetical protein
MHHIERRTLLGDEQHALSVGKTVRDDVGDGLRFAVPGGPSSTKSWPAAAAMTAASCEESALPGTEHVTRG